MSKFADQMGTGNAALQDVLGDSHSYWPAGVEEDAISISVIWTDTEGMEQAGLHSGKEEIRLAEAQVLVSDVAAPKLRHDKIIHGGVPWVVSQLIETVAGMHRLRMEWVKPTVRGHGRGR